MLTDKAIKELLDKPEFQPKLTPKEQAALEKQEAKIVKLGLRDLIKSKSKELDEMLSELEPEERAELLKRLQEKSKPEIDG